MINDNRVLRISEDWELVDREIDIVLADAGGNAIALVIPSPQGYGEYRVRVENVGDVEDVTVTVAGGHTINNIAEYILPMSAGATFVMDELGDMHTFYPFSNNAELGDSQTLAPTQAAVKAYVDAVAPSGPAAAAHNTLSLAANVASTETVTIGADVYEVEIVNTDSTDNTAGGDFANTTDPLVVVGAVTTYSAITFAEGALVRIQNEILRVTDVTGDDVTFQRGASGTTVATHANALDIFVGDGIAGGSTVAVGLVTTLTPAAFSPALIDDINSQGTEDFTASSGASNAVIITADAVGAAGNGVSCDETLAGAGNVWASGTTYGGHAFATLPLVYKALLTQTSTTAPTAFVLENTLGNVVWTRSGAGAYVGTLTGAFGETTALQHGDGSGGTDFVVVTFLVTGADTITLATQDVDLSGPTAAAADDLLGGTYVEITVYAAS